VDAAPDLEGTDGDAADPGNLASDVGSTIFSNISDSSAATQAVPVGFVGVAKPASVGREDDRADLSLTKSAESVAKAVVRNTSTDAMLVSKDDQGATERSEGEPAPAIGGPTHDEDYMSTEGANALITPGPVVAGTPLVWVLAGEVAAKTLALATTSSSCKVA
jgi:hypothetical protein